MFSKLNSIHIWKINLPSSQETFLEKPLMSQPFVVVTEDGNEMAMEIKCEKRDNRIRISLESNVRYLDEETSKDSECAEEEEDSIIFCSTDCCLRQEYLYDVQEISCRFSIIDSKEKLLYGPVDAEKEKFSNSNIIRVHPVACLTNRSSWVANYHPAISDFFDNLEKYAPENTLRIKLAIFMLNDDDYNPNESSLLTVDHEKCAMLGKYYKNFFEEMILSDLTIKTGDNQLLKAHKSILAARSAVFLKMFTTEMTEKSLGIINIVDFGSLIISELLRFIYYGEVENIEHISDWMSLFIAADKYEIEDLKATCHSEITTILEDDDLIKVAEFACLYNLSDLLHDCAIRIQLYICDWKASNDEWKNLNPTVKNRILEESLQEAVKRLTSTLRTESTSSSSLNQSDAQT